MSELNYLNYLKKSNNQNINKAIELFETNKIDINQLGKISLDNNELSLHSFIRSEKEKNILNNQSESN